MKEWNLLSYIKKYRVIIVLVSLALGALFYMYFSGRQTYTARAVIRYANAEAVNGLAPDGTEIDTSEIYSSEVMTKVFQELNLGYDDNNMDAIRSGVSVKPILSDEEEAVQTALNADGQVPEEQPTTYVVSYKVNRNDVADAEEFSAQILKTMLKVYMETYAERHVNKSDIPNTISGVYDGDYDYIEMVEILEGSVSSAIQKLTNKSENNFRSAETGYSFRDLSREFQLIQDIDLSQLYAYVLGNTVTKDQDVLLSKYENRITDTRLSNDSSQAEVNGIQEIINSYVNMMRQSGNVNFTYEYILAEVYDNYYTRIGADQMTEERKNADITTEYDALMNDFVTERTTFERALVDIAYYQYILDVYTGNTDGSNEISVQLVTPQGETAAAETTAGITAGTTGELVFNTETAGATNIQPIISSQDVQDTAYQMIKTLADRLDVLYQQLRVTNQEYNQYAGAQNIAVVTDAVVTEGMNLKLYAAIAVVLFGIIGCALAVVIGRLLDIFDYYVYIDKKLGVANRAGCDRYIGSFAGKMIPPGMVCVAAKLTDIEAKNRTYGREQCDAMIKDFADILQSVVPDPQSFIAVNAVGQFVIFMENVDKEYARAFVKEVGNVCIAYNQTKACKVSFVCGISSCEVDEIYDIRKLMIAAMTKAAASGKTTAGATANSAANEA